MRGGCAGFFTDEELAQPRGVVDTRGYLAARAAAEPRRFEPPLSCDRRNFDADDLQRLGEGDLASVFGAAHDPRGRNSSLRLPHGPMRMIDRVVSVTPDGGAWGLGTIEAEKDLAPDDWYFPCHFQGDQVLAGSLMSDGCSQLLQVYLLFLGLHTRTSDARFQPVAGVAHHVVCRGQVTPEARRLTYRLEVTALEDGPRPSARANCDILVDGLVVVRFVDLALELAEKTPVVRARTLRRAPDPGVHVGSVAACFGPEFAIYEGRRVPRNPNGDLQLLTRIVDASPRGNPPRPEPGSWRSTTCRTTRGSHARTPSRRRRTPCSWRSGSSRAGSSPPTRARRSFFPTAISTSGTSTARAASCASSTFAGRRCGSARSSLLDRARRRDPAEVHLRDLLRRRGSVRGRRLVRLLRARRAGAAGRASTAAGLHPPGWTRQQSSRSGSRSAATLHCAGRTPSDPTSVCPGRSFTCSTSGGGPRRGPSRARVRLRREGRRHDELVLPVSLPHGSGHARLARGRIDFRGLQCFVLQTGLTRDSARPASQSPPTAIRNGSSAGTNCLQTPRRVTHGAGRGGGRGARAHPGHRLYNQHRARGKTSPSKFGALVDKGLSRRKTSRMRSPPRASTISTSTKVLIEDYNVPREEVGRRWPSIYSRGSTTTARRPSPRS